MSKKKGPSYTAKAKSRVNYPKLKTNQRVESQKDSSEETEPSLSLHVPRQSPSIIRKETVTLSKPSPVSNEVEEEASEASSNPPAPSPSISRKDTVVLSRATPDSKAEERTGETEDVSSVEHNKIDLLPTKDEFIKLIETEQIFESQHHRAAILGLVTGYARNVRRAQILELLDTQAVFEDVNNLEEVISLLTKYVRSKTNNNHQ